MTLIISKLFYHVVNAFPLFYVYFRFLWGERTRNPQFCTILLREDESTAINISAVIILSFLLREIAYSRYSIKSMYSRGHDSVYCLPMCL